MATIPDEILKKHLEAIKHVALNKGNAGVYKESIHNAMSEYATLQCEAKDKEFAVKESLLKITEQQLDDWRKTAIARQGRIEELEKVLREFINIDKTHGLYDDLLTDYGKVVERQVTAELEKAIEIAKQLLPPSNPPL